MPPPPERHDAASPTSGDAQALRDRIVQLTKELEDAAKQGRSAQATGAAQPPATYEVVPCVRYTGGCLWHYSTLLARAAWRGASAMAGWTLSCCRQGADQASQQYSEYQKKHAEQQAKAGTGSATAAPAAGGGASTTKAGK